MTSFRVQSVALALDKKGRLTRVLYQGVLELGRGTTAGAVLAWEPAEGARAALAALLEEGLAEVKAAEGLSLD